MSRPGVLSALPTRPFVLWPPVFTSLSCSRIFQPQRTMSTLTGSSLLRGESGKTYKPIEPLGSQLHRSRPCNIWLVKREEDNRQLVAKAPSFNDDESSGWPGFYHELGIQRLFREAPMIRKLLDYVPPFGADNQKKPFMILELFGQTLWDARMTRPMTMPEVKWIMKGILLGVGTIQSKGLVHTDLKMENIGITGFNNDKPNVHVNEISVRISDCGLVTQPGTQEITSLTYRSPEVFFGKPWDTQTDIWSWGIILAQLLLAQVDFSSPGLYDKISVGTLEDKTRLVRDKLAIDFDLHSIPFYADDAASAKLLPPPRPQESYMWASDMNEKGVSGADLQFLVDVLNPRPDARLSAREIMESGYLDK